MAGVSTAVVRQAVKRADDASLNEQITRRRVDAVEAWLTAFTGRGFWGRLRWLLLGR